ncbi:MAG: NAD(P)(+) transhydrogenase (Re/Si-specific) subunit alpha, partial [Planctomycetota bacterium]
MIVAVPKETAPGERRVALVPKVCATLIGKGHAVQVESGAGLGAGFADSDYEQSGATIAATFRDVCQNADIVVKVQAPLGLDDASHECDLLSEGSAYVSFLFPLSDPQTAKRLADRKVTSFAMDLMPRITRAQSMDALSSMSSIAGYKAVLRAADLLPRYFPMLMTAAGTITPARVLILGAGVAGLQAIATARRLGAVVEAFDIRPVVKEQVESLGARFVDLETKADAQDAGG